LERFVGASLGGASLFGTSVVMGKFTASRYELLALAMLSINGVNSWQRALRAGLGYETIFNLLAALACVIYYCSASELTSRFPFPGGCFGFARCTVGFYLAFLIGCMEFFYYITSISATSAGIAHSLTIVYPEYYRWRFLIVFGVFVVQYCLCMSKKLFYRIATLLALYGIVINLAYIFGCASSVDFSNWAYRVDTHGKFWNDDGPARHPPVIDDDLFYRRHQIEVTGDRMGAMFNRHSSLVASSVGRCLAAYMQIEYANLAVDDAKDPRRDIPFALLVAFGVRFVFQTINPFIGASIAPGLESVTQLQLPMIPGKLLGIIRTY
jgi:amino acid transporter